MTDPPLTSCKLDEQATDVKPKTSACRGCSDKKRRGLDNDNGKMTGVTTATAMKGSRLRQRKTAVYKRFWAEDTADDDDGGGGDGDDGTAGQRISGRSGSGSFSSGVESDEEMIRFPCVERLIELYANIIKQKEAETARFASRVVAGRTAGDGDKRRLDKTAGTLPGDKTTANVPTELQSSTVSSTSVDASSSGRLRAQNKSSAPEEDGWSATRQSPYCSSDEEDETVLAKMKPRDKVTRSSSSDSALGLDEDLTQQEQQQIISSVGKARRMTLGVSDIPLRSALLPVPEPALLPTSDCPILTSDHNQCPAVVRSKMILEAQLIELPQTQPTDGSTEALGCLSNSISRRESAQSYVSDSGMDGVRYVRTPSVVVSDYSDDTMCGITLEEIEYLRRHRLRRASTDCESDVSAASSCSNLNYCGSSISALEGCDYQCGLRTPERKVSDCSTCSTLSCEDADDAALRNQLQDLGLRSGQTVDSADPEGRRRTKKKVGPGRHVT
ncbi:uncharacterized protein LOC120419259 isoform X1 [Culex pipiens pallens]|uniref:uncharacterized protein LOC120419259 isoform X1 n=1 Tax=Culex pipiens pallens TaxID=42434 RepID=UPI001952E8F2|nr:uncharacterized protein LOC120419259 isoform X1 [Culex pipiens pallens]